MQRNCFCINATSTSRPTKYTKKKNDSEHKRKGAWRLYGTPEGTFLFQYLPEKKLKQKELEKKSKQ